MPNPHKRPHAPAAAGSRKNNPDSVTNKRWQTGMFLEKIQRTKQHGPHYDHDDSGRLHGGHRQVQGRGGDDDDDADDNQGDDKQQTSRLALPSASEHATSASIPLTAGQSGASGHDNTTASKVTCTDNQEVIKTVNTAAAQAYGDTLSSDKGLRRSPRFATSTAAPVDKVQQPEASKSRKRKASNMSESQRATKRHSRES